MARNSESAGGKQRQPVGKFIKPGSANTTSAKFVRPGDKPKSVVEVRMSKTPAPKTAAGSRRVTVGERPATGAKFIKARKPTY